MTSKGDGYFIEQMDEGGFTVCPAWTVGSVRWPVYACTDIDEALNFIRVKLIGKENSEIKDLIRRGPL